MNIILSTGMANLNEIKMALGGSLLVTLEMKNASIKSFEEAFNSIEGKNLLKEKFIYSIAFRVSCSPGGVNLNTIQFLKKVWLKRKDTLIILLE